MGIICNSFLRILEKSLDRLQTMAVFVAVAEESGFASAASVTRAVSELEARLRVRLFHRTTRTVKLSEAGARYLGDCRRVLADVEQADGHASGVFAAPRGVVSVTASALFGRMVLAPAILDLLDRYPEISVRTIYVDRVVHLIEEGIDVAVRIAELPDSSLSAVRVGRVRRVLCASPGYLEQHGRPRDPAELKDHDLIDFVNMTTGGEWVFQKNGKNHAIRPHSQLMVNNADPAIAAALAGRGITRVLSYMIAPYLDSRELEIVLDDYTPPAVPIHVVHKEAGQTSARVRAVVDHLVEQLRKNPTIR